MRLQEYGVGLFQAALTKSALKKALKKHCITVNDQLATSATWIHEGDTIQFFPPGDDRPGKKLLFPLDILFEDDYLAAIHKPAGILVSGNNFKTITHALPQNVRRSPLPDATTPQPVHRLDYPTTGILLAGKTSSIIRALNQMFKDKAITKTYYAVTIGAMPEQGQIITPVEEKPAHTKYTVVASEPSRRFGHLNLVRLTPLTGRRHQLRKHLSAIGNPILGDQDYGIEDLILKGKGLYLHAFSLSFTHPFSGETLHLEDALPERFGKLFPGFNPDA
ncbi:MAG: RluA family pseudouridine synthase [Saprospiraceae bacterium]|nr:RluA family pseudouridine synthase [Saprospiraceae bacterium]